MLRSVEHGVTQVAGGNELACTPAPLWAGVGYCPRSREFHREPVLPKPRWKRWVAPSVALGCLGFIRKD